jgi:serine/threonine protein kinase
MGATGDGPEPTGGGGPGAAPQRTSLQSTERSQGDYGRSVYDDYEIGETLGKGSFAVVKEGWKKSTGQKYAIKIIEKNNPGDPSVYLIAMLRIFTGLSRSYPID